MEGKIIECLIVDDEPVARAIIRNYCDQLSFLLVVAECGNALEAKEILSTQVIDLLFLDIHMPVLNGISFLNTLKNPPQVIFTTAYQEHAVTAFDLAASDYLLKPFSFERFIIAIDKVQEHLKKQSSNPHIRPENHPDHIFIKSGGKIYRVLFINCLYAEAQGNYTKIVTNDSMLITKVPFSTFISQLPENIFIRVHRSFIINKTMISHIEGNRVFVQHTEIPIANNLRDGFLKAIGAIRDK
jgi:DNA-binding LytR/AlgR family response regulator